MGIAPIFEPLQLHLQPPDLLEQLCLLGLSLLLVLGFLAPGEQLAGTDQQLPLPLAHLDGVDGVVSGDLLDRLAATDRLHSDPGLELGTMGAALTHGWEPPFRGGTPPQRLTMGAVQKNHSTSERALWPEQQTLRLDFSQQAECAMHTVLAAPAGHGPVLHEVLTVTPQDLVRRCNHIDILKLDIEGAESALFSSDNDLSWLNHVDVIIIELHDRFERGCSRNFWASVSDLSEEAVIGENICVARPGWLTTTE